MPARESLLPRTLIFCVVLSVSFVLVSHSGSAAEPTEPDVAAGHSYHGEAFNEGPRQAARLIEGMAEINFPTSAKKEKTQAFIEQGVSQLHGFWFLEAERSFRQAAQLEPDLAIAYWGMAVANANNDDRARGLIDEAMERRQKQASKRERLYIEALNRFLPKADDEDDDEDKEEDKDAEREANKRRAERYIADLEKIVHEFPDDIEAKAFIALHLWTSERRGVKMASRYATSALLGEVFDADPSHPAHHYRIHLWDRQRPENALESAALCGPSSPGIAHMWHMPGHIYSKLKRYSDAAWQQEASARVDHAHMNRARLIPDQIHNYAHNNEWLTRNLLFIGRVDDALDQAKNLVSLPRHPQYNTLKKRGSYKYGRMRLLQTVSQYGLWDVLLQEAEGRYLPMTDDKTEQADLISWLAVAHFKSGDQQAGADRLRSLRRRLLALRSKQLDAAEQPESDSDSESDEESEDEPTREQTKRDIESIRRFIARASAAASSERKDKTVFQRVVKRAKLDKLIEAQWTADSGDLGAAIKLAEAAVREGKGQVRPKAVLVDLLWRNGNKDRAKKEFKDLRKLAGNADIETPLLADLEPVAKALDIEGDWRIAPEPADDLGERPELDSLGPFRWQPYLEPSWVVQTVDEASVSSEDYTGRPRLVIFYLGFGCLHCVEQLHAFDPVFEKYRKAGIDVVAISTESVKQLGDGIKNFEKKLNIPLMSDESKEAFKGFRCWDDFEDQPLHGTFLIDANNRVRWQDISYEPFMEAEWLLEEADRLFKLPLP